MYISSMSNEDSIDRRSVLRRAGAVAALSAGSGVATANSEPSDASQQLQAADELDTLVEQLAERGLIDEPTPDALALEPRDLGSSDAGTFRVTGRGGTYTASVTPVANGEVRVFRRLDDGKTYAIVDDDGPTRRIDPDGQADVVQSSDCPNYCSDNQCSSSPQVVYYYLYQAEDELGDCYVYDTDCTCEFGIS